MPRVTIGAVVSLLLMAAVVGCGPNGPEVVDVQGRITKGGKPVAFALVHFWPEEGRASSGRTDAEGKYRLSFSQSIPHGAVLGKHRVYFGMEQGKIDEPANPRDSKYHPEMVEILRTYGSYQNTPIVVEVTPKQKQLDIELDDFPSEGAE